MMNPACKHALEAALQIKEKYSAIGKSIDEKSSMKKSNKKASGYSAIIAIIIKTA